MDRLLWPETSPENLLEDRKLSLTVQEAAATFRAGHEVEALQAVESFEIGTVTVNETSETEGICGRMHRSAERAIETGHDGIGTLILERHARRPRPERGRGHRLEEVFGI